MCLKLHSVLQIEGACPVDESLHGAHKWRIYRKNTALHGWHPAQLLSLMDPGCSIPYPYRHMIWSMQREQFVNGKQPFAFRSFTALQRWKNQRWLETANFWRFFNSWPLQWLTVGGFSWVRVYAEKQCYHAGPVLESMHKHGFCELSAVDSWGQRYSQYVDVLLRTKREQHQVVEPENPFLLSLWKSRVSSSKFRWTRLLPDRYSLQSLAREYQRQKKGQKFKTNDRGFEKR